MKIIQNKVKTCFYDKNWKKELQELANKKATLEMVRKFIEQQKDFSYMAGYADGLKDGLYERKKNKDAMNELTEK